MGNIKNILLAIGGLILAFFYALLKSKDRKIEKQGEEIKQKDQKIEEGKFINEQNNKTTIIKNDSSNMSDDAITSVYDKNKWFSD